MSHMANVSQQPSISLIDCVEFKINGNINKNAILLEDCDDDRVSSEHETRFFIPKTWTFFFIFQLLILGFCLILIQKNELLVGTLNGELLIFKDDVVVPFAAAKDLGMVCFLFDFFNDFHVLILNFHLC